MEGILFLMVMALALVGYLFHFEFGIFLGVVGALLVLLLAYIKSLPVPQHRIAVPQASPKKRHKLIQAPEDMWKQEDMTTYMAAMQGSPMHFRGGTGFDPFAAAVEYAFWSKKAPFNRHTTDFIRNILPFSAYGRTSLLEHIFIGLPIGLGSFLYPYRYKGTKSYWQVVPDEKWKDLKKSLPKTITDKPWKKE
ncbi:MAG: hypothetical protein J7K68_00235 [Candidatus Diapherotrites archaeon]|nr:hypothetical protein [Candidatus Diapherotrites archaeon]